jgi:GT2 family glycosyltransferase
MGNLLIAVPTTDYLHAGFVKSLMDLSFRLHRDGVAHEIALEAGTLVYLARNRLANKAINEGFDRVLWLDSDMVFQPDIVDALEFCGKPFVCGAFQSRRPPYSSCVFKDIRLKSLERVKEYGLRPFQVDGCGFACVLMKTEVLEAVSRKHGKCFTPMEDYGEDLAFCVRAKEQGYEIWCDPTARVGHIAHIPIWPGEEPAT